MKKGFKVKHWFVPDLGRGYYKTAIIIAETKEEAYLKALDLKLRKFSILLGEIEVYE